MMIFADSVREGLTAALRAQVPEHVLARLDEALPSGWMPISESRYLVQAVVNELGPDATTLWRRYFSEHYVRTPALRTFATAAVRLLGLSPNAFLRIFRRGFESAFRGVASVDVTETDARSAVVRFEDVAPIMLEHPQYFLVFEGSFEGILDVAAATGTVEHQVDRGRRVVEFDVRWD